MGSGRVTEEDEPASTSQKSSQSEGPAESPAASWLEDRGRGHIFSLGFFEMQSNGGRLKPFPAY